MDPSNKFENANVVPSVPGGLCFSKENFTHPNFSVDALLQQLRITNAVPLEVLRDDLGVYLKVLRSAMIELINRDYADFVNLSSNLVGLDKRLETLQGPLSVIKEEVLNVKNALDDSYFQLSTALEQRQEIREQKAVLECLMKIPCSLEHVEKLLQSLSGGVAASGEDALRGNIMERAANEFNHLQHYIAKCGNSPLIAQLQTRTEGVKHELMLRLEDALLCGLQSGDEAMLKNSLRTFALLDKCQSAELLVASKIVKPNMEALLSEAVLKMEPRDLPGVFANIKKFIRRQLKEALNATTEVDSIQGFNFVANSIWPSFSDQLLQMASIFAPGNPDLLQKRYLATVEFIDYLEILSGSILAAQALRNHPNYQNLLSRWNLPVYFQIRFQDIAGHLEASLAKPYEESKTKDEPFKLEASCALWKTLNDCYAADIYLPALGHRFWKLTLQLIARFSNRISCALREDIKEESPAPLHPSASSTQLADLENPSVGGSLPHSASMPRLAAAAAGSASLTQYVYLYSDICRLVEQLPTFWPVVQDRLEQLGVENMDGYKDVFFKSATNLEVLLPKITELLTADLKNRCSIHLRNVTDIPRLYRRTNREAPSKSCVYVSQLLAPINEFRTSHSETAKESVMKEWIHSVIVAVSKQYLAAVSDVLTSVQKTEESLKRLRKARAPASAGSEAASAGMSDDDKIRMQLVMDVEAFLQQIDAFFPSDSVEECRRLYQLAENARPKF